ncbi:MAG: glycoside hydrolase family 18 protein [Flavobacteriaceae bacterium]|nr:glycoside hydrolase family 18 protein [Flavobacteriaceae bacterium]
MKRISLLFIAVLTLFSCQKQEEKKYNVVAYVAGYRDFDFSTIDAERITHINYAFANVIDGKVQFDTTNIDNTSLKSSDLKILQQLKSKNPDLKILVSVGGWTWSGNFSDASLTEESRKKFAESCAIFVEKYGLDGIDIDWEYPNQEGAGNTHRPEDKRNFTLLLKEVRNALNNLEKKENHQKHYLQTIATGANKRYIDNTELGEAQKYLDFINIMTYDFYNGWHKTTGHHANFKPSATPDKDMNSVVNAVKLHLEAGVPKSKLNVGIPFYGRKWEGVQNAENNGLFQPATTVGMIDFYRNITKNINQNGYTRYWDKKAQVPYLWNPTEKIFISYEDEQSITFKINYIKELGLAGAMFWEYSDDKDKTLLKAVNFKK